MQEAQLGVDKIIDALDIMETEEERKLEPGYQPNVMLLGLSGSQYLLRAVSSIRANDLDTASVSLSFTDALTLLKMIPAWIEDPLNVRFGLSCICGSGMHLLTAVVRGGSLHCAASSLSLRILSRCALDSTSLR